MTAGEILLTIIIVPFGLALIFMVAIGYIVAIPLILIATVITGGSINFGGEDKKEKEFKQRVDKIIEAVDLNIINDTMTDEEILAEIKKISEAYKKE